MGLSTKAFIDWNDPSTPYATIKSNGKRILNVEALDLKTGKAIALTGNGSRDVQLSFPIEVIFDSQWNAYSDGKNIKWTPK